MADYVYSVCPPHKRFDTRHEAVGWLAIHRRKYTYHPSRGFRIEAYKRPGGAEVNGPLRFDDLQVGDQLRIQGERFTVQQIVNDVAALVPRNENGSGRLEHHADLSVWVFNRRRGVEPEDVEVVPR